MHHIQTLIQFGRPHTILASSIQVITLFIIVGGLQHLNAAGLALLALTLVSSLCVNIYIVGLNQITDLDIDRMNKPHLPLVAGTLSIRDGRRIVAVTAVLSLVLALVAGPILLGTIAIIFIIGTLYSLPPLRLKRFPIAAALSVAAARGILSNIGVALHFHDAFDSPLPLATVVILGVFFFGFAIVIALYKDLPDSQGDRMYAIETFTTRLGPRRVLMIGQLVLTSTYLLPVIIGITGLPQPRAIFLLISHVLLIGAFWVLSTRVNLDSQQAIKRFYMYLWLIFYTEFVVLSIYETAWSVA
jgi:homogentisate phytyltransferase/homogentisate geranylgeranyltransferase